MAQHRKHLVVFVSDGSSGFSYLAQQITEKENLAGIEIRAMVSDEKHPDSLLKQVLKKFDIPDELPASLPVISAGDLNTIDLIISFDADIPRLWSPLPGAPSFLHWFLPNPMEIGLENNAELLAEYGRSIEFMKLNIQKVLTRDKINHYASCRKKWIRHFESLNMAVMVHDRNRHITYFNQKAQEITGYKKRDVLGKDCHDLYPWSFCNANCGFCNPERVSNIPDWFTRSLIRRSGEIRHVEMTTAPVLDSMGTIQGAIVYFHDLTYRIQIRNRFKHIQKDIGFIGDSAAISHVFESIQDAGPTDVSVMIQGDSGTGKELVAESLHRISRRATKPFVVVNCGALPEGLLESELFGHVKGSFTGAIRDKKGRFEVADGGTIFLDEIAELSPMTQVKILRVLQDGSFDRVGGVTTLQVDVRVISATNRDISDLIRKRLFREDLYYRLCGFPILVPPLKDRDMDIMLLTEHYLDKFLESNGPRKRYTDGFMTMLQRHQWPGNIRELQNTIQFSVIKSRGEILDTKHLPDNIQEITEQANHGKRPGRPRLLDPETVADALEKSGGNKVKAAKLLGVSRATLYRLLNETN